MHELAHIIHQVEKFCGDCGTKRPIHVANRCFDKVPRASTARQGRHDRRTPLPFDLPAVCRKKLTVDFNGGNQSSNGGLLLVREAERKLGVCSRLADAMPDRRDPDRIRHAMFEMVMARAGVMARIGRKGLLRATRAAVVPLDVNATTAEAPIFSASTAAAAATAWGGECSSSTDEITER
jgi:hypothetical protein